MNVTHAPQFVSLWKMTVTKVNKIIYTSHSCMRQYSSAIRKSTESNGNAELSSSCVVNTRGNCGIARS